MDKHLNGLPTYGIVAIGAPPGSGKTALMTGTAVCYVRHYHEKKQPKRVIFFSLEMTAARLMRRCLAFDKMPKYVTDAIWVCEEIIPIEEIVAEASRAAADGVDMICIDFADLVIEGEETEQKMASVYRGLMVLAKNLQVPILLASQLSRKYAGGVPRLTHLRYSGLAEALSEDVWLLHNPNTSYGESIREDDEKLLPTLGGRGYVIVAKGREGFGEGNDGPGAIMVKWDGGVGWNLADPGKWMPLGTRRA